MRSPGSPEGHPGHLRNASGEPREPFRRWDCSTGDDLLALAAHLRALAMHLGVLAAHLGALAAHLADLGVNLEPIRYLEKLEE